MNEIFQKINNGLNELSLWYPDRYLDMKLDFRELACYLISMEPRLALRGSIACLVRRTLFCAFMMVMHRLLEAISKD